MKLNEQFQSSLVFARSPSAKLQAVTPCHHNCLISMHDEFCVCLHRQALAPKGAKGAPAPPQEEDPRTIVKMTQKFSRNPEVPAEQDVARRVFDIANGCIRSANTLSSTPQPPNPLYPSSPAPPLFLFQLQRWTCLVLSSSALLESACIPHVSLKLHDRLNLMCIVTYTQLVLVLTAACISQPKCNTHERPMRSV